MQNKSKCERDSVSVTCAARGYAASPEKYERRKTSEKREGSFQNLDEHPRPFHVGAPLIAEVSMVTGYWSIHVSQLAKQHIQIGKTK